MAAALETEVPPKKTNHKPLVLALIVVLFALRYLVTAFRVLSGEPPAWFMAAFEIGTYFLVAAFLILEVHSLKDYHITPMAAWIIILFKPIETLILGGWQVVDSQASFALAFPKTPAVFIWANAVILFLFLRPVLIQKGAIQRQDWIELLAGLMVGLLIAVLTAIPAAFTVGSSNPVKSAGIWIAIFSGISTIPYQFGYAAISEEPVFRGFLWGWLRKVGRRDVWIWLFQAGLFTLAHLYYLKSAPLMFWFSVPLGGLVLGWLAWRYRSIAVSMAAHGVVNGLDRTLELVFAALKG